jgi:uncharacterized protein (TIGR02118 family)
MYHCVSASHKQLILEDFVGATGYVRKYALWLLNHAEEVLQTPTDLRRGYWPEVEQALVLAWKTFDRIWLILTQWHLWRIVKLSVILSLLHQSSSSIIAFATNTKSRENRQCSLVKVNPFSRKEDDTMIRVNIFYPNQEGGRFDLEYYLNIHMPMALEKLGPSLKGVSIEHGVSGVLPGTQPAYVVMCNYTFDTAEAFLAAFLPNAELLQADMPNYTDIEPVMQFSEIKMSQT